MARTERRMLSLAHGLTALLTCTVYLHQCNSFQVAPKAAIFGPHTTRPSPFTRLPHPVLSLSSPARQQARSLVVLAADESPEEEAEEQEAATSDEAVTESIAQKKSTNLENESSSTLWRTVLLAVPLFCKFVIVLGIKFLTDLVVLPLLLLYRLARLTKRRILGAFAKLGKKGDGINGSDSRSSTTTTTSAP